MKENQGDWSILDVLIVILIVVLVVLALNSRANSSFEERAKDRGFEIVEVAKLNVTIVYNVKNETEFFNIAFEIGTTTIYHDTTPFNGLQYVIANGTVGWNYVP